MKINQQLQNELESAAHSLTAALAQTVIAGLREAVAADGMQAICKDIVSAAQAPTPNCGLPPNGNDEAVDPIIGLEKIRRKYLDEMSKTAFYGGGGRPGFVHLLNVVELGPRRRGVRLSNFNAVLDARTRQEQVAG